MAEARTSKDYELALEAGKQDAWQRSDGFINGRHLLIGVIVTEGSAGQTALKRHLERAGSSLNDLQGYLDASLGMGKAGSDDEPKLSGEGYNIQHHVAKTADDRGIAEIGSDHLLIGIIEKCEPAREIIERRGVDIDELKRDIEMASAY